MKRYKVGDWIKVSTSARSSRQLSRTKRFKKKRFRNHANKSGSWREKKYFRVEAITRKGVVIKYDQGYVLIPVRRGEFSTDPSGRK